MSDAVLITGVGKRVGLHEFQRTVDYIMDSHYVTGRVLHLDGGRHLV
jgi:dihydromonapterin reductase/dihydrofolate reductase